MKRKRLVEPSNSQGTNTSQPLTGRQTRNSNQAGKTPGLPNDPRLHAQKPVAQRVLAHVTASQKQTALQTQLQGSIAQSRPDQEIDPLSSELSALSELSDNKMALVTPSATTGAAGSSSGTQNIRGATGENQNPSITLHTSTHKMPKLGEKNESIFDPEKLEELGRFFDWFADEGITDDVDKKQQIVKYLDADSEIQWKALSKFTDGTFEEFEKEVMAFYPKAEEIMKGSVSALKKKIKKLEPIAVEEHDELLSLIRTMTAEVLKLKKIQPSIHMNRELVDLLLRSLAPEFASRVASKLSVHHLMNAQNPEGDPAARNPEDMYDIEDVMKMAKHMALDHLNPFGKYLHGLSGVSSEVSIKLEEAVA